MALAKEPNTSTEVINYNASTLLTSWDNQDVCGAGSFATVRKCEHEELGEVVVKCFNIDGSNEKPRRVTEAVEREMSVLERLSHKNIVKILGITKWANCVGIILEYVNGESLEDLLLDKTMYKIIPWHLRFHIFYDIINGLAYLHRYSDKGKAFVHGDLKPQNILLTVEFVAKIADFGSTNIARATATGSKSISIASTGQHTPYYTAPEVLKNVLKERKTSMDVYSIGIITYEICTRRSVFKEAANSNVVIQAIIDRGQKPNEKYLREVEEFLQNRPNDLRIFKYLKNEMSQCWNTLPQDRPNICDVRDRALQEIDQLNQVNPDEEAIEDLRKVRRDKLQKSPTSTKVKLSEFFSGFQSVAEPHSAQQAAVIENDQTQRRTENGHEERETDETALLERNDEQRLLEGEEQNISRCPKYKSWRCKLLIICFVFLVVPASIACILLLPSYPTHHELKCPSLNLPQSIHAKCTNKTYIGSTCSFSCGDGKVLSSSSNISCNTSGQWTTPVPNCISPKAKECPELKLPDFVQADCTNGNYVGSECNFSCSYNHVLSGPSGISCKASLQWTSSPPNCVCPACTTGPSCTYSTSWSKLKSYIVDQAWASFTANYAGYSIKCRINKHGGITSFNWDCTCTDILSSYSHRCNNYKSPGTSCEHSLAFLLRDMIKKGTYPEPCDASALPEGCG